MLKRTLIGIGLSCFSLSVFAVDQVIKEETTPPASEGAITPEQIQSIYSSPGTQGGTQAQPQTGTNQTIAPAAPTLPGETMPSQQPMMQTAPQTTTPQQMQTAPQNSAPQQMQAAPQNIPPAQQQPMQQNTQQPSALPGY